MTFQRGQENDNRDDDDFEFGDDDMPIEGLTDSERLPRFEAQSPNLPPRQAPYRRPAPQASTEWNAVDAAAKKRHPLRWILLALVIVAVIVVVLVLNKPTDAPVSGQQQGLVQDPATTSTATKQPTLTPSSTPLPGVGAVNSAATNAVNQDATANAAFVATFQAEQALALTPTAAPSLTPVPKVTTTPLVVAQAATELKPGHCRVTGEDLFIHWGAPYTPQSENGLPQSSTDASTVITAVEKTSDGWVHIAVVGYLNANKGYENLPADVLGWVAPGSPIECNLTGVQIWVAPTATPRATATPRPTQVQPTATLFGGG